MNSTDKLLKCIVCQKFLETSLKIVCAKGHIHCQECANSLDNACGLCELPIEPIGQKVLGEANANNATEEQNNENPICKDEQDARNIEETDLEIKVSNITVEPSSNALELLSADLGSAMYETLKSLHKSMCQRKCKTFEHCINNILVRVIDESVKTTGVALNSSIQGTGSLTDLLETLHVKMCKQNCDSIEICLNQTLKEVIKNHTHQKEKSEIIQSPTSDDKQLIKVEQPVDNQFYVKPDSNVVHAVYQTKQQSKKPKSQFEFLNKFPKSFEPQSKANDKPQELKLTTPSLIEATCPILNCKAEFDITTTMTHLEDHHKNLTVEVILPKDCRTFFIDPSILEPHETDCLHCYFLPTMVETNDEYQAGLPIFLLVCRTSLRKLYAPNEAAGGNRCTPSNESEDLFDLNAEIDEAIYGANSKLKRKPVVWSKDDVLVTWPVAAISHGLVLKTALSTFVHGKPTCHRAASFNMRSLQQSRDAYDVFGAPDTLTLTNVEIEALTTGGQHAIQCQILINF